MIIDLKEFVISGEHVIKKDGYSFFRLADIEGVDLVAKEPTRVYGMKIAPPTWDVVVRMRSGMHHDFEFDTAHPAQTAVVNLRDATLRNP